MKYLLDTHIFIWILEDNPRLKPIIRAMLPNRESEFFISTFTAKAGHNDPSDHMIICQALVERMTLISADENFPAYRSMGLLLMTN